MISAIKRLLHNHIKTGLGAIWRAVLGCYEAVSISGVYRVKTDRPDESLMRCLDEVWLKNAPRIEGLDDLVAQVENLQKSRGLGILFRGAKPFPMNLIPKTFRKDGWTNYEYEICERFRASAPGRHNATPSFDDYVGWLTLMQHHGLPTRLLDWTESAFLAAYFATCTNYAGNPDRLIWVISPLKMRMENAEVVRTTSSGDPGVESLASSAFEPKIEGLVDLDLGCVPFFPQQIAPRMMQQQSVFTIHYKPEAIELRDKAHEYISVLVIPTKAVIPMRKALDAIGIDESSLFPDLDNLAKRISRNYDY
jgi:hypothetical protein